jgi:hypothetical protein
MNDLADPEATKSAIAKIIKGETAEHWRPKFAAADCCVTIMASLEEALHDPHFVERGLFAHIGGRRVRRDHAGAAGAIAATLRDPPGAKPSPKLGRETTACSARSASPRIRRGCAAGLHALAHRRRGAAARCGRADRAREPRAPCTGGKSDNRLRLSTSTATVRLVTSARRMRS